jgi:CoA:oxalate CoA-transferase
MKKWGLRSTGNRHPGAAPHSYFKTKDGYVAHMSLTNEMWKKLLDIIGKGNLKEDPRYDDLTKRKELWRDTEQLIEEWSTQHTTEEVLKIFKENRLPCGKVRDIDEVYDDPHNAQRKIFQSVQHAIAGPIEVVNVPLKMSETPTKITAPSPILGEHNYEILSSILGYSREKVDELTHKKILYQKK